MDFLIGFNEIDSFLWTESLKFALHSTDAYGQNFSCWLMVLNLSLNALFLSTFIFFFFFGGN